MLFRDFYNILFILDAACICAEVRTHKYPIKVPETRDSGLDSGVQGYTWQTHELGHLQARLLPSEVCCWRQNLNLWFTGAAATPAHFKGETKGEILS